MDYRGSASQKGGVQDRSAAKIKIMHGRVYNGAWSKWKE